MIKRANKIVPALDGYYLPVDKQSNSYQGEIAMLLKKKMARKLELNVTHIAILEGKTSLLELLVEAFRSR